VNGHPVYWTDLRAQAEVEARVPGWGVYRFREERCFPGVYVPPGWYYAAFWRLGEPQIAAETLDELERLVRERMDAMPVEQRLPRGAR
jgi:hypothetical protein